MADYVCPRKGRCYCCLESESLREQLTTALADRDEAIRVAGYGEGSSLPLMALVLRDTRDKAIQERDTALTDRTRLQQEYDALLLRWHDVAEQLDPALNDAARLQQEVERLTALVDYSQER